MSDPSTHIVRARIDEPSDKDLRRRVLPLDGPGDAGRYVDERKAAEERIAAEDLTA